MNISHTSNINNVFIYLHKIYSYTQINNIFHTDINVIIKEKVEDIFLHKITLLT